MAQAKEKLPAEMPQDEGAATAPPLWEWLVGWLGLALVLGAALYLALQARTADNAPPDPVVQVAAVHEQTGGYVVVLRVQNRSRATAANLKVTGTLSRGGQAIEQSDTEFQFLPGGSTREGGLFFTLDPRGHSLEVRATGYEKP